MSRWILFLKLIYNYFKNLVPEKLGSDVINVEKSFFIIQITGRMSDGHPSFSGTSGQMSDAGLNPISATSSDVFLDAHVCLKFNSGRSFEKQKVLGFYGGLTAEVIFEFR